MPRFQHLPGDYYQLLGVGADAGLSEIEGAYWGFARALRGQAAMAAYNEAYEVLANSHRRRIYDAERGAANAPPPPLDEKEAVTADSPPTKFGWPAA